MLGAACLVSLAAMRSGAGLVTAAIPKALNLALQEKLANAVMTMPVTGSRGDVFGTASFRDISRYWTKYTAVAIGPGLGTSLPAKYFVMKMVSECPLPMIIDADALNLLAGSLGSIKGQTAARVLTPHPGEFARLSGEKPENDASRKEAARRFSVKHNVVLILKGHRTVIASPDGKFTVNNTGNPGMAKAGMGDVLTGMIVAYLAQGIPAYVAAKEAVYRHGLAGDKLLNRLNIYAFTASDLIDEISKI